ncbi:MAG: hypothetical protein MJE12_22510 [Alphaproteobacteria bacterium]|nr:hypothetical protein [Alphaproteobacteria bacterium]
MLIDQSLAPPHPDPIPGLSPYSEFIRRDTAFRLAVQALDEAEHRQSARQRAWAAIRRWMRNMARDPLGPSAWSTA